MGKYTQTFALHYDADPNRVWAALQQAIENMDGAKLGAVNDAARELELETGVTSTSWGGFLQSAVKPGADAGLGDRGARPPARRSRCGASRRAHSSQPSGARRCTSTASSEG